MSCVHDGIVFIVGKFPRQLLTAFLKLLFSLFINIKYFNFVKLMYLDIF
jgi:hypothetical protein